MDGGEPLLDDMRAAAVSLDAGALDDARLGFHRRHPRRSARRVLYGSQLIAGALVITGVIAAARVAPQATFGAAHVTLLGLFVIAIL